MEPLYTADNTKPAYQLNWGLTMFWRQAPIRDESWLADLKKATESDDVRVVKHRFTTNDASQFFVSTKPHVSPAKLLWSVKGRLQNLIKEDRPKAFQRNYSLRSIGSAKRSVVEKYLADQLGHHRMADLAVQQRMGRFQRTYPDVDLSKPCFSAHGQYWYNLHVGKEQRK